MHPAHRLGEYLPAPNRGEGAHVVPVDVVAAVLIDLENERSVPADTSEEGGGNGRLRPLTGNLDVPPVRRLEDRHDKPFELFAGLLDVVSSRKARERVLDVLQD